MIRSMFTAISALSLHQKYLDVVSNNLANANTTGYKASRVLFQDQYAQMMSPGASPTTTQGGTNPAQIGLGVTMGYVSPNFTQGTLQSTGRNMDLGIQGDGFFVYGQDAGRRYSREGSMSLDSGGYLVDAATGLRTQGWMVAAGAAGVDTNLPATDIQVVTDKTQAKATENIVLGGNLTANGTVGDKVTVSMGVYDSLGSLRKASVEFTRTAAASGGAWDWKIVDPATPPDPAMVGNGSVIFDAKGQFVPADPAATPPVVNPVIGVAVSIPGSTGANAIAPTIDFSKLTMLSTTSSAAITSQDGLPSGTVSDVFISPNDGTISLVYTNGLREQVGQLALARFTNPTGLVRGEHTTFLAGLNSGEPEIGTASTGGRGSIASGYLEASNVDMAQEFTNMILAQRGFQASSRVITTSDEILQELVNLKR